MFVRLCVYMYICVEDCPRKKLQRIMHKRNLFFLVFFYLVSSILNDRCMYDNHDKR